MEGGGKGFRHNGVRQKSNFDHISQKANATGSDKREGGRGSGV